MSTAAASSSSTDSDRYTLADQVARFARAKKENNERYLNIESVYDPSFLKGLRVAVTGANRGIGLALATELTQAGAQVVALVRSTSQELQDLRPAEIIEGVDVQNDATTAQLSEKVTGGPIDIVSFLHNNDDYGVTEND
jgi:NADPH:quinone reductase-like Zn-dependent oxidoreductase